MRLLCGILGLEFDVTNGLTKLNALCTRLPVTSVMEMLNALKLRAILLQSRNNRGRYLINRDETETSTGYLLMSFNCTRNFYLFFHTFL